MTGYAVTARIRRVEIGSPGGHRSFDVGSPDPVPDPPAADGDLEEIVGGVPWSRLLDLRDDVVTTWRQTTFYLFDPDSWR
jgi:hypothetical protein